MLKYFLQSLRNRFMKLKQASPSNHNPTISNGVTKTFHFTPYVSLSEITLLFVTILEAVLEPVYLRIRLIQDDSKTSNTWAQKSHWVTYLMWNAMCLITSQPGALNPHWTPWTFIHLLLLKILIGAKYRNFCVSTVFGNIAFPSILTQKTKNSELNMKIFL